MPSTQKVADIVIVGSGSFFETIKTICAVQKKKNVYLTSSYNYHFVSDTMISVDGQKITAKKFLIHTPEFKIKDYGTGGTSALYLTADKLSMQHLFENPLPNPFKRIVTESSKLLPEFDSSVQKVATSLCKKLGIKSHTSIVFHSMALENAVMQVYTSKLSKPALYSADKVVVSEHHELGEMFGIANIPAHHKKAQHAIFSITKHIALVKDYTGLTLSEQFDVAEFLCGKRTSLEFKNNYHTVLTPTMTLFSIGMIEQEFAHEHVAYKKALVKLHAQNTHASWFVKVITTNSGHVIGIHGALPFAYNRLDCFRRIVNQRLYIDEIAHLPQDDALNAVCLELIGELA